MPGRGRPARPGPHPPPPVVQQLLAHRPGVHQRRPAHGPGLGADPGTARDRPAAITGAPVPKAGTRPCSQVVTTRAQRATSARNCSAVAHSRQSPAARRVPAGRRAQSWPADQPLSRALTPADSRRQALNLACTAATWVRAAGRTRRAECRTPPAGPPPATARRDGSRRAPLGEHVPGRVQLPAGAAASRLHLLRRRWSRARTRPSGQ